MIHQDPYDSINPRMKIGDIISEPLEIHNIGTKRDKDKRVIEVLREVKLEPAEEISKKISSYVIRRTKTESSFGKSISTKTKSNFGR